ncbi:hypothetical protein TSUD_259670 [Trifolium subterraneum]|uniref:Uncharacterized protein n=1 Tax=Trifolium subterraneum TaxID=3900 RepID=A0A2Z6MKL4_TRISU|nr:hypothetical protein TSUD_259670 [Trifolium subterraneum]
MVWMMIVDASFLLELLQIYAIQEGATKRVVSSSMSHLVDYACRKSAHNAMLRDLVMLENQIPLCVLRKMIKFKFSTKEAADEMLIFMFIENDVTIDVEIQQEEEQDHKGDDENSKDESSYIKQSFNELWKILSKLNKGPMKLLKRALVSRPLKLLVKFPWKIITNLPGVMPWIVFNVEE